jgi:hypothetical protein
MATANGPLTIAEVAVHTFLVALVVEAWFPFAYSLMMQVAHP